jgi:hypothetical protein
MHQVNRMRSRRGHLEGCTGFVDVADGFGEAVQPQPHRLGRADLDDLARTGNARADGEHAERAHQDRRRPAPQPPHGAMPPCQPVSLRSAWTIAAAPSWMNFSSSVRPSSSACSTCAPRSSAAFSFSRALLQPRLELLVLRGLRRFCHETLPC